ncbi:MAG: phenylalanine--tRNA ligase subunit alpha [bacterium]|nr:phenylalanine--tRNA ligase subunit alpha [bacterium]
MDISKLKNAFAKDIKAVKDANGLEELKVKYLGRKGGELNKILKSLKDMSLAQKQKVGPAANALRMEIELALGKKEGELYLKSAPSIAKIDVSLPGKKIAAGHLHPLTRIENKIKEIFLGLNFSVVEGPEAETEYYNFDALNIPANHPARDMWDTFWLGQKENLGKMLMRTHTSPMQVRYMEKNQPPIQIVVPGRVFRFEATDASHEINFHQVEGLMVGENINLANFKYVIEQFFKKFFSRETKVRFRPSYFPFVEPGLEVDVEFNGKWLEVMGAGMVHPAVLDRVKLDPKKYQGFAFGVGVERLAMIKYKIPDIRMFYSGDLRFINQF